MGMTNEEREVREMLERHDCYLIRKAKHGDIWGLPGGETLQCYSESDTGTRDWRAWKNILTELRRKLRAAGVLQDDAQDDDEDLQSEGEESNVLNLESLGIHVQRKKKQVVIYTEVAEATVSGKALAQLLGLLKPGEAFDELTVVGADGKKLIGADDYVTIKVGQETVEEKEAA